MFKDAFDFYCEAKLATLKRLGEKKKKKTGTKENTRPLAAMKRIKKKTSLTECPP